MYALQWLIVCSCKWSFYFDINCVIWLAGFLGAISALSTRPELLQSIFVSARTKEEEQRCQKYGIYILKFYKWVEDDSHTDIFVVIDDRIPVRHIALQPHAIPSDILSQLETYTRTGAVQPAGQATIRAERK